MLARNSRTVIRVTQRSVTIHRQLYFRICRTAQLQSAGLALKITSNDELRSCEEVSPGIERLMWGKSSAAGADSRAGVDPRGLSNQFQPTWDNLFVQ
jgi:hypothetical protein